MLPVPSGMGSGVPSAVTQYFPTFNSCLPASPHDWQLIHLTPGTYLLLYLCSFPLPVATSVWITHSAPWLHSSASPCSRAAHLSHSRVTPWTLIYHNSTLPVTIIHSNVTSDHTRFPNMFVSLTSLTFYASLGPLIHHLPLPNPAVQCRHMNRKTNSTGLVFPSKSECFTQNYNADLYWGVLCTWFF